MIASFLWMHKEHLFGMLEYAITVPKIFHVRAGVPFSFFLFRTFFFINEATIFPQRFSVWQVCLLIFKFNELVDNCSCSLSLSISDHFHIVAAINWLSSSRLSEITFLIFTSETSQLQIYDPSVDYFILIK